MKKTLLFTCIALILVSFSYGQATIKGNVTDKNGETLIGVTISLESKPGVGVTTDLDGNYTLTLPDATTQTLVISYISYETKKEIIHPVMGETIVKNFILQSVSTDLGIVEIKGKADKSKGYYMENLKKNSASSIDFIPAEVMKKTGDVNVTAAVTRVSGVSMSSNGFISVRGISDRYVKTTINGMRIPTLDPFTNNLRLDIFPASLIDNVILTKTASPDLPGDWAGAYISLETKDSPEKFTVNLETSVGYNNQTTFKEILTSKQSKTDWLGYDNGYREYNHSEFTNVGLSSDINLYMQMQGLGLKDYLTSLGVTPDTKWNTNHEEDPIFILCLVKLGLLDKELQANTNAVKMAVDRYNKEGYYEKARQSIAANSVKSAKAFKNNWVPITQSAPLNFSQSFSIGNQTKLFGRPLGIVAGFRYGSSIQNDPDAEQQRAIPTKSTIDPKKDTVIILSQIKRISKETNTWSALLNLNYKLNINNTFSLLLMPNFNGVNNVSSTVNDLDRTELSLMKSIFYEQRKQLAYQLKSEHFLPVPQVKINFNASYTNGKSSAPDYKILNYKKGTDYPVEVYKILSGNGDVSRYFRYLTDNLFDTKIDAEIPLKNSTDEMQKKLKAGASYQTNFKKSDQLRYEVFRNFDPVNSDFVNTGDVEKLFDPSSFDFQSKDGTFIIPFYYLTPNNPLDHTFGKSTMTSGFVMLDYSIFPFLRATGGLRAEKAEIYTDFTKYDAMKLPADDERRGRAKPGKLNELSLLPSTNLIFKLKKDPNNPVNLRLNYSQSVARPSIRELSSALVFDYEYQTWVVGNPDLKMAKIKNYDLRLESYFKSGENISASFFYKDFKDHIELTMYENVTWQNVKTSSVYGIELEGKKKIIKQLELRTNVTFVHSETNAIRYEMKNIGQGTELIPIAEIKRVMFGQAPYILNGMLMYTADSLGLSLTLSYNVQGPKLAIASVIKDLPDVYELPRHVMDFKISKKLGKHLSTSLTVRDILNSAIVRAYKYDTWDIHYDGYRYGTNYVLALSYQF